MRRLFSLALLLSLASGIARGQDLEETLSSVGSEYAQAYVAPMAGALAAGLNAGLFRDVRLSDGLGGVDIYVGVHSFGAFLQESDRSFDLSFEDQLTFNVPLQGEVVRIQVLSNFEVTGAPTLFGEEQPAVATVRARLDTTIARNGIALPLSVDTTFTREIVGGLLPTDLVPAAVPHVRIGTLLGTDLMIRWLPTISASDLGSVGVWGVGVRHSLSQYVPLLPFEAAVQVAWQQINMDDAEEADLADISTFAASLMASRRFGLISIYGGVQTERYEIDVRYEFVSDDVVAPVPVSFSIDRGSHARAVGGVGLHLGPVQLNADYSLGAVNVASVGLGVAF